MCRCSVMCSSPACVWNTNWMFCHLPSSIVFHQLFQRIQESTYHHIDFIDLCHFWNVCHCCWNRVDITHQKREFIFHSNYHFWSLLFSCLLHSIDLLDHVIARENTTSVRRGEWFLWLILNLAVYFDQTSFFFCSKQTKKHSKNSKWSRNS